jgi:hypothetical protein
MSDNNDKFNILAPSFFVSGCKCGHGIIFRSIAMQHKNKKHCGVTIKPKKQPTNIKLKITSA